MDDEAHVLERAWRASPADRGALERAIAALERTGDAIPDDMRHARVFPGRELEWPRGVTGWAVVPDPEGVWRGEAGRRQVALEPRSRGLFGALLGATRRLDLPEHHQWGVIAHAEHIPAGISLAARERASGLRLSLGELTSDAVDAVAAIPTLRLFGLRETRIAAPLLARFASLTGLHELWLEDLRGVTDATVRGLASLAQLRRLSLAGCGEWRLELAEDYEDALEEHLAGGASREEAARATLDIMAREGWNGMGESPDQIHPLTDASVETLLALRELRWVDLRDCGFTTSGVRRIIEGLPKLETLGLGGALAIPESDRAALEAIRGKALTLGWDRKP